MSKLLICDLDGTLLGDDASLRILLRYFREPAAPVLAFASGRQGYSATALLAEWDVKLGAYLIAGVGTEIYRRIGKRWMPIGAWPELNAPWDGSRVRGHLAQLEELRPQSITVTSSYKLSYFASADAEQRVARTLHAAGLQATIVHSHGDMLDVLPPGIDKGSAVAWLARRLAIPFERMMTCGNTINDLAMLKLPCASVVVGDSEHALREAATSLPNTYLAKAPCADGVIEGLRAFGWLRGSVWR
jgi:sucrose-phosphate synthase